MQFSDKPVNIGPGRPTVLLQDEESEIVAACHALQDLGYGLTREMVASVVAEYISSVGRPNPFSDGGPGPDWWYHFFKRWPSLQERKPEHLSKKRAEGVTKLAVDEWILTVEKVFKKHGFDKMVEEELSRRLWNTDETGLCLDATSKKVLARRGVKSVYEVGGGSGREYITVLACGSADGVKLPPLVVYKAKNLWARWTRGGPAGTVFSVSDSGWMEEGNFKEWFKQLFIPAVSHLLESGPVVLFADGHGSHIGYELIDTAMKHNIVLMCLPPHTSHVLQPLDVTCFAPMKQEWKKALKHFKVSSGAMHVSKSEFLPLLKIVWEKSLLESHLRNGFKACGLHPLSREAISTTKLSPSPSTSNTAKQPARRASIEVHCTCNHGLTPLRLHLRDHFSALLQPGSCRNSKGKKDTRKVKPAFYGQALTTDDVLQILSEREEKRQKPTKGQVDV